MTTKRLENILAEIQYLYLDNLNKGWPKLESYDSSVRQVFLKVGKLNSEDASLLCETLNDLRDEWGINETIN